MSEDEANRVSQQMSLAMRDHTALITQSCNQMEGEMKASYSRKVEAMDLISSCEGSTYSGKDAHAAAAAAGNGTLPLTVPAMPGAEMLAANQMAAGGAALTTPPPIV